MNDLKISNYPHNQQSMQLGDLLVYFLDVIFGGTIKTNVCATESSPTSKLKELSDPSLFTGRGILEEATFLESH